MDIGNVALTITHLIVLLSICNMSYQLIKIKSSVSRKGYKNTIIKLLITEIVMILCNRSIVRTLSSLHFCATIVLTTNQFV